MAAEVFKTIGIPREHASLPVNRQAEWYTWSDEFRSLFKSWRSEVEKLPIKPELRHTLGGQRYDRTFSLPLSLVGNRALLGELKKFAQSLYNLEVAGKILLFSDLLDEDLDGKGLHFLLAVLRELLAQLCGDEACALYAPLGSVGKRRREFPLHADLYIPEVLFNIFDEISRDESGKSIFLRFADLQSLMALVPDVPDKVSALIRECTEGSSREDRFERLFTALHREPADWRKELEDAMYNRRLRIKMYSGQGYLINDRVWLHGREAPRRGISCRRLHRLIYNTRNLQERRRQWLGEGEH
ncbi:MAG TPA: hypothetical protein VLQ45_15300 [Thermoanaerobaculia bacterium]|nr:hypothetical protein [Thermoanaerobaculia bacterium]